MTTPTLSSMTGFCRLNGSNDHYSWMMEARSVNGKGLDIKLRAPSGFDNLEQALRKAFGEAFKRGNISVSIRYDKDRDSSGIRVDEDQLAKYLTVIDQLVADGRADKPRADGLMMLKGVLDSDEDPDAVEAQKQALEKELVTEITNLATGLKQARDEEGQRLASVVTGLVDDIENLTKQAASCEALRDENRQARLKQQVQDVLGGDVTVDEQRLAQELALIAVKGDVREELDRLNAHIEQAREFLVFDDAIGRRFDFLCQEFNREANTLCSKSGDVELTRVGMELKSVIDRLREQIQNIE